MPELGPKTPQIGSKLVELGPTSAEIDPHPTMVLEARPDVEVHRQPLDQRRAESEFGQTPARIALIRPNWGCSASRPRAVRPAEFGQSSAKLAKSEAVSPDLGLCWTNSQEAGGVHQMPGEAGQCLCNFRQCRVILPTSGATSANFGLSRPNLVRHRVSAVPGRIWAISGVGPNLTRCRLLPAERGFRSIL